MKSERNDAGLEAKIGEAINRMLQCLLSGSAKVCKSCDDVESCRFLTEAVFTYRAREWGRQFSVS